MSENNTQIFTLTSDTVGGEGVFDTVTDSFDLTVTTMLVIRASLLFFG